MQAVGINWVRIESDGKARGGVSDRFDVVARDNHRHLVSRCRELLEERRPAQEHIELLFAARCPGVPERKQTALQCFAQLHVLCRD